MRLFDKYFAEVISKKKRVNQKISKAIKIPQNEVNHYQQYLILFTEYLAFFFTKRTPHNKYYGQRKTAAIYQRHVLGSHITKGRFFLSSTEKIFPLLELWCRIITWEGNVLLS